MAEPEDIDRVRKGTNEPTTANYSDEYIGDLVDAIGVSGACVSIWEDKSAKFSTMGDVSEAGASHKLSQLYDNAMKMLAYWKAQAEEEAGGSPSGRPKVRKIQRT